MQHHIPTYTFVRQYTSAVQNRYIFLLRCSKTWVQIKKHLKKSFTYFGYFEICQATHKLHSAAWKDVKIPWLLLKARYFVKQPLCYYCWQCKMPPSPLGPISRIHEDTAFLTARECLSILQKEASRHCCYCCLAVFCSLHGKENHFWNNKQLPHEPNPLQKACQLLCTD